MSRIDHIRLMAAYNATMNERVFAAAAKLPADALAADRKAFFGSILGTLNHIANGDVIWLKRFALHPAGYSQLDPVRALPDPASLGAMIFADLDSLWTRRRLLDETILAWSAAMAEDELDHTLHYGNSRGVCKKNYFSLVMHFFNHQTHHRGQASTLLSQEGVDIGVTDLLFLIPDDA
ncbi:DinB family protein [Massilia sp. R2A-15]|uniref:DinB family protein n=1 Tax=Massilia sp. R2A-15 TaxID=3064278 RepID=UPI00273392CB|nr:DinB family protein [Massilia sp. R2A-15]WLI87461.1 DinB family protein [Massilia sp. R2A-15]